jgi:hypothetical protein
MSPKIEHILYCAMTVLKESEDQGLTRRKVAETADMKMSNVQYYLKTKELLLGALTVRQAHERGQADFGWLKSAHTLSFGQYHDPKHIQYGVLRVINDDQVDVGGRITMNRGDNAEMLLFEIQEG